VNVIIQVEYQETFYFEIRPPLELLQNVAQWVIGVPTAEEPYLVGFITSMEVNTSHLWYYLC